MRIETYQASKHGASIKHTGSCKNCNFEVLKLQFVALYLLVGMLGCR